jgi:hypothetical protein
VEANLNKSRAALFLGKENPNAIMERLFTGTTPNKDFDDVYVRVIKDQSGRALNGLKRLYAESFLSAVERSVVDVSGDKVLSESLLNNLFDTQSRNIERLYGKDGKKQIENALAAMRMMAAPEKARVTKVGSDTVENLTRTPLWELIGRMTGVHISGALPSAGAGSIQRAGMAARIGQRLFGKIGANKRKEVLTQAFEDPKKMKFLLSMELTPENEGVIAEKLHAWMGGTANEIEDVKEEQDGQ